MRGHVHSVVVAGRTTSVSSSFEVSFLSYQCRWSSHCRSSSIGGWAPYFSLAGMFRSSTNTTAFLPMGGPYTPLRRLRERGGEGGMGCEGGREGGRDGMRGRGGMRGREGWDGM